MNHAAAQAVLGNLFWDGTGVNRNIGLALTLFILASANAKNKSCSSFNNSSKRWIGKALNRMSNNVAPELKKSTREKIEELHRPCHGEQKLIPIDGIIIKHETNE